MTSPTLKQIHATIWDTKKQLQHTFFQQSNDQGTLIQPMDTAERYRRIITLYSSNYCTCQSRKSLTYLIEEFTATLSCFNSSQSFFVPPMFKQPCYMIFCISEFNRTQINLNSVGKRV